MANISNFNIAPTEELDLDSYQVSGDSPEFPKKGRYQVRAPEMFPEDAFKPNAAGTALTVLIDPTIVGPTAEGKVLRYIRVSGKTFQRGAKTVSMLGDYLKACGITGTIPGDPQAQADAIESTAGAVYEVDLDWRVWEQGGFELKSMNQFPSDGNGGFTPYVESPTQLDESGNPKRLWANLNITRFVSPSA